MQPPQNARCPSPPADNLNAIFLPLVLICFAALAPLASAQDMDKETSAALTGPGAARRVLVTDEGVPSAYGAPASFSRSRFANLTNAYVLPPYGVYAGLIYAGSALRFNRPDHIFTQEIEVGLPHRFGVAIENGVQSFRGRVQETTFSLEGRYAFADWNKIPLNPTVFVEYRKGIGDILHDEGAPHQLAPGEGDAAARQRQAHIPDGVEVRLLLAADYHEKVEWALNLFFEQEIEADRGREWGFAQSIVVPVLPREQLKLGVEMQYSNFTDKDTRGTPANRFILGPTAAFKPTRNTRIDISPLFGVTYDAPRVEAFAVLSYVFGPGGETGEAEAPASTRNR